MPANEGDSGRNRQGVQAAADVRRMLATQIENVMANPDLDPIRKAQVIAQLTRVALRAIELDTLQARVESIETTLKLRKEYQTKSEKP